MREEIRQEPAARREARPSVPRRHDVEIFDLEQIARLRALHIHRPGQRMHHAEVQLRQFFGAHAGTDRQIAPRGWFEPPSRKT